MTDRRCVSVCVGVCVCVGGGGGGEAQMQRGRTRACAGRPSTWFAVLRPSTRALQALSCSAILGARADLRSGSTAAAGRGAGAAGGSGVPRGKARSVVFARPSVQSTGPYMPDEVPGLSKMPKRGVW